MQRKMWIIFALVVLSLASTLSVAQTFTDRPSAYTGGGSGYFPNGFDDPTYAYDGNLTTDAYATPATGSLEAVGAWEIWYGFSSEQHTSGMTLNISSAYSTGEGGSATLWYSLNGGSTWNQIYQGLDGESRSQATNSISLSNSQNLTLVQVKAEAIASSTGKFASTANQYIYEIWITGSN